MTRNNSTNLLNTTSYIVSASGSQGAFTTIQSAVAAASAAGGGVVYVKPGTYFENIAFPTNVSVIGDNAGVNEIGVGLYNATIFGFHTFPSGACAVSFSNLVFGSPPSGSSPLFSIANSSGQSTVNFQDCIINDTLGVGTPPFSILCAPTGTGTSYIQLEGCQCVAGVGSVSLGANSTLEASTSSFSAPGTEACVLLNAATSVFRSSYNKFDAGAFACIRYAANGTAQSLHDSFLSSDPSGFYIKSSGAFGVFRYGESIVLGSSSNIDPQVAQTIYAQRPDAAPLSDGQVVIGRTGNFPVAAALTAGSNISISSGPGSITISATTAGGLGLTWNTVNTSFTMAANNGYNVISGPGTALLQLPAAAVLGSVIVVTLSDAAGAFSITQGAGQRITFGNQQTTIGSGGSISSNALGDSAMLVCTTANTSWSIISAQGNLTIV